MSGKLTSKNHSLLLCIVLFFANSLVSFFASSNVQDYRYQKAFKVQRLSLQDGLSQSVVKDVIQDSDGYIWLATEDGLNRFDSYEFKIFQHDHKNNKSLHENWVISLIEEPGYGMWVGTVAGLSFYDPEDESFTDYSALNSDLRTNIPSFALDDRGVIWIATDNGLFYVDRKIDKILPFISSAGKTVDDEITSLTESLNDIYAATSNCIYAINKNTNSLINICDKKVLEFLNDAVINVLKIHEETLWIGTSNGLYKYNIKSNKLVGFKNEEGNKNSITDNIINDLIIDKDLSLWIATPRGLNLYNKNKEVFERYSQQIFTEEGLSSNDVISLYTDNEGLIWLGTYGGGVNILNPNQHQFEHLLTRTDVINAGNNNTIHGIEKDKYQNLWLASYGGGLINYDLLTGNITRPLSDAKFDYDEYVYSLLIDHSNRLWVGTLSDLEIIDVSSKIAFNTRFVIDGQIVNRIDGVTRIYEDHQGKIWIGSENGLFKVTGLQFKNKFLQVELIDLTHKLPNSFSNFSTSISTIVDDQYGNFWIGGYAGLVYYKVKQNEWDHYHYDKKNPQSLSNNSVQVIYEDSLGFLWVGTADGLNRVVRSELDDDTFYFERITTYEGLPNNAIYGILEDKAHQLWISTTRGLVKYSHNAVNMDVFRSSDGLSSDEFNTGAYFSDNEGKLFFGSINGITIVNQVEENPNVDHKKIFFSRVNIGDRSVDIYQLNHSGSPSITQQSNETAIDISVVNINYDKLGTQRYRYRLLGLEDEWNYLGLSRNMFIAGLPQGRYQLEIESQLAGQLWGQKRSLTIQVNSSFWNSRKAYFFIASSILLLFLATLFILARVYKNKIKRINQKMNVELLRSKELRADNETLKLELQVKESEVNSLNKKIEVDEIKLGFEKYRDATTGFYHLSYLSQINEEELIENLDSEVVSGFSSYNNMVIFELMDYSKVNSQLGPLAVAELVAKVSIDMRQKTGSQTQVFCVKSGMFLALNSQVDENDFRDDMINLRHQVVRSEFNVANGVSAHSGVLLSLMNISHCEVSTKTDLITMIDLMIKLHESCVYQEQLTGSYFQLNNNVEDYSQDRGQWDVDEMIKTGALIINQF